MNFSVKRELHYEIRGVSFSDSFTCRYLICHFRDACKGVSCKVTNYLKLKLQFLSANVNVIPALGLSMHTCGATKIKRRAGTCDQHSGWMFLNFLRIEKKSSDKNGSACPVDAFGCCLDLDKRKRLKRQYHTVQAFECVRRSYGVAGRTWAGRSAR